MVPLKPKELKRHNGDAEAPDFELRATTSTGVWNTPEVPDITDKRCAFNLQGVARLNQRAVLGRQTILSESKDKPAQLRICRDEHRLERRKPQGGESRGCRGRLQVTHV